MIFSCRSYGGSGEIQRSLLYRDRTTSPDRHLVVLQDSIARLGGGNNSELFANFGQRHSGKITKDMQIHHIPISQDESSNGIKRRRLLLQASLFLGVEFNMGHWHMVVF